MPTRIEMNVTTGEHKVLELTPAEVVDAQGRTATESAKRLIDNAAAVVASIKAELVAADLSIIRALVEGDKVRLAAHASKQAQRRAKLK